MTDEAPARGTRNAERTRAALLAAARTRFATQGYRDTTVKAIADDAGVNASLVNRYFGSKEGLFEECMGAIESQMKQTLEGRMSPERVATMIARTMVPGPGARSGTGAETLTLLMRSSGDEAADKIRVRLLQRVATSFARAGNEDPTDADVIRAQFVLCTALGLAMAAKWAAPLEPLASASSDQIHQASLDLVVAMLAPRGGSPAGSPEF